MLYINSQLFGNDLFMNGEVNFKCVNIHQDNNVIRMKFRSNIDIANLLFAYQYIKDKAPKGEIELQMLYTPYSRMDREINEQLFSLRYLARLLATMDMNIVVIDNHSHVLIQEFDDAGVKYKIDKYALENFIRRAFEISGADTIMMPDAGAFAKYGPICVKALGEKGKNVQYIHGNKKRDLKNKGKITNYELNTYELDIKGSKILIVDDICSFGGTAKLAAQALRNAGASEVHLYITHSELNLFKGDLPYGEYLDSIITTDTVLEISDKTDCKVPVYILKY